MSLELPVLPEGWIQQYDSQNDHPFWVDTKAKPPRSTWVHPYEDERFLNEHPDIRDRIAAARKDRPESDGPPPYSPRRHSFSAQSRSTLSVPSTSGSGRPSSQPPTPRADDRTQQRGFLGKLKDKTLGTHEEREEARRQRQIAEQRQQERMLQIQQERQRAFMNTSPYGNQDYYAQERYGSPYGQQYGQQYGPQYGQQVYGAPAGDPFAVSGGRYGRGRFGGGRFGGGGFGGGGLGGGGMALPLLGGLAGGLLLGDVIGDFGGGGFGGGGFDGGFGGGFF